MTAVTFNLTGVILRMTADRSRKIQVFFKKSAVMFNLTGVILRLTAVTRRATQGFFKPTPVILRLTGVRLRPCSSSILGGAILGGAGAGLPGGRVGGGRGGCRSRELLFPAAFAKAPVPQSRPWLRFPPPLIEPDVRISRIRLSDGLHERACTGLRFRRIWWRSTTPIFP